MDALPLPRSDAPARMEPLAKLPVFWALEDRRAVVAGGGDAAMWKAELLAACGATVDVYAPVFGPAFEALEARGPDHPAARLTLHRRPWSPADLHGAVLAIGDCEEDDAARAFVAAACAAGVPANVIDRPEFCQFQFGSIVNRSPVIVAISTDGAAPILAQTIRRKIETLLPRSLKAWAALAQAMRETVNRRLSPGARRRAFWEGFADRVFSTPDTPEEGVGGALLAEAERLAEAPAVGRVTVVGAGPGDAELLTLKAVRALQAADIILFDPCVGAAVLELARREATRVPVGRPDRRNGRPHDADAMMMDFAKAGKRVVRLVPGDAAAVGSVAQTLARLGRAAVPVDIVPGVAAAHRTPPRRGRRPASPLQARPPVSAARPD